MEKDQIDIFDMGLSTENHFNDNPTPWNGNVPITNAKAILSGKLADIGNQLAIQIMNTKGSTIWKEFKRKNLESEAFLISAALSGYAASLQDSNLYNRVHFVASDFRNYRDAELIGVSVNLLTEANALLANLTPFGITAVTLNSFNATIQGFQQVMKDPTEAIARRKSATEKIGELIPDLTDFLKTNMDNLVVALTPTAPDFVKIYHNVRLINNSPTNNWSLTTSCIDSNTHQPTHGVTVSIPDENMERITGFTGFNTFVNISEGTHTVRVTHVNYQTQELPFTCVSGETTELVIMMVHH